LCVALWHPWNTVESFVGQEIHTYGLCFARTWLQIPERKKLLTPVNGNTRYRSSLWNLERTFFRKILWNHEDPSMNITLHRCYHYCENDKARRKRAFSLLLRQSCSYHTMSVSSFRKICLSDMELHKQERYDTIWQRREKNGCSGGTRRRRDDAAFIMTVAATTFFPKALGEILLLEVENSFKQLWWADLCPPFSCMLVWCSYAEM
jgi:hypothetical protein